MTVPSNSSPPTLLARFGTRRLPSVSKPEEILAGRCFTTDDEVLSAVDTYLQDSDSEFYNNGIKAL